MAFLPSLAAMLALTFAAASMVGCGGVRKSLGFAKQSPDEFAVVRNAPLTVPPDYTLRPPRPGAQRPQEAPLRQQAADSIFNRDSMEASASARPAGK